LKAGGHGLANIGVTAYHHAVNGGADDAVAQVGLCRLNLGAGHFYISGAGVYFALALWSRVRADIKPAVTGFWLRS